jgi:SAM-dependent methyltransferase
MAHPEQAEFFSTVRSHYRAHFAGARVLEVGSLDINGSVRELFEGGEYVGVDLQPGPGVDLACPGQLLELPSGHFDTVISAECFEHNPFWRETFANMLRMCRPGGLVLVSCASIGRKEHGTTRTNPEASPFTVQARWDYYRNLTPALLAGAVHLDGWLSDRHAWINHISRDLYFIGLRGSDERRLPADLVHALDRRYALTATPKALRRGLKARLFGDLLSRP